MATEVPKTLKYRGGQLNAAHVLKVENFTNWKRRFMFYIIGIEPQFENIISNGPFIPMTADQKKPDAQWTADERKASNLDQQLKSLIMSVLPDDQMNYVINYLTAKSTWDDLILYHKGPYDVKESRVMDLKLCYNTFKFKEDCPDDEEDTRSSQDYINNLEEEYQARALLAKSKRFIKKGTQRFSSAKATDQTECHKCGKKGHFARDYWSKTSDEEEVSSDDNEVTEVKVLIVLADEEKVSVGKESARNVYHEQIPTQKKKILRTDQLTEDTSSSELNDSVFVKSSTDNSYLSITNYNKPKLSEADKVSSAESQRNKIDPSVTVTESSVTNDDSHDESSVCSTPLLLLKKLDGAKYISGSNIIKSILKSKSTFKAQALEGIIINEPSSTLTRGNKSSLASKTNSSPAGKENPQMLQDQRLPLNGGPLSKTNHPDPNCVVKEPGPKGMYEINSSYTTEGYGYGAYGFESNEFPNHVCKLDKALYELKQAPRSEVGLNTFRNAIGAHYLPHSSEYVAPPSIDVVRQWFLTIRYGEEVSTKGTLRKSLLPPSKEATKGRSSKAPTSSKTGHSKKRKESSLAIDLNLSQPSVSIPVDTKMHKEDQQVTSGLKYLRVTSVERASPHLSSCMSAFNLNKHVFTKSFIVHSESALGCDASAESTAEADLGLSALIDFIPQQQGMDEGTKNTSFDHIYVGTNPYVLAYQTKSVSKGLETALTQPTTKKGASSTAIHDDKEEPSSTIKLEDLAKLVPNIQLSFKDMDSPKDDPIIVVDDSYEDEKDKEHTTNVETEDTSVPKSSSPMSSQIQELTNQILSVHDFSSSLPTKLKDLPSKINKLTEEIKGLKTQVHKLEFELPKDLKEIQTKLEAFTKTVTRITSQVAKLKTLQWELSEEFLLLSAQELIKKYKGKKEMYLEEAQKESTNYDSDDAGGTHVTGSMVEYFRIKKLKKFDFVTEEGMNIYLSEEEINNQKKLEEEAKAEAAKKEGKVRKA
nr:retrovirus-related Pol polyprotein from transposon TNT 1-94 [Tanacetum cinerariifolium]